MAQDLPTLSFGSAAEFAAWLAEHHGDMPGLWMSIAKKGTGITTLDYPGALDIALCWGWIDGQKKQQDEHFWLQRFTPRTTRSKWSKINCDKAEQLIARGVMQPAGLRQVEAARADGRWEAAYAGQRAADVPEDLAAALAANPAAAAFFATLDGRNRYSVLYRIQDAKKESTRAARITKYVAMLAEEKKIYP
jgi:uncharacterized protein YdeI (YjbR/CyaY-like superfamily)